MPAHPSRGILPTRMGPAEAIYREYMQIWRSKARVAQGLEPPQPEGYTLQGAWVRAWQECAQACAATSKLRTSCQRLWRVAYCALAKMLSAEICRMQRQRGTETRHCWLL